MANIFDYLEWRADVPLSVDPFNEVDNLVLSELAYTDFHGIISTDGTPVSISDAHNAFFTCHTREEISVDKSFTAKAPLLMDNIITGCRFGNMTLSNYLDEIAEDYQLSAVVFNLDDGTRYVAFRGTDGTVAGWKEDFNFSFMNATKGQQLAVQYLNNMNGQLRVGGHSKGGNLAVFASAFCSHQEDILEIYSNDGPGFREDTIKQEGFQQILPKVKSIVPDSSIIGLLLSGKSEHLVVKSSAMGILQHDALTWQIKRNRFETASLSDLSMLTEKMVGNWLVAMDDEARKSFIEIVFFLIESTGKDTFSSMSKEKWKTAESILNAFMKLPKEKQQEGLRFITQIGQSSGQTIVDYLSQMINKKASH